MRAIKKVRVIGLWETLEQGEVSPPPPPALSNEIGNFVSENDHGSLSAPQTSDPPSISMTGVPIRVRVWHEVSCFAAFADISAHSASTFDFTSLGYTSDRRSRRIHAKEIIYYRLYSSLRDQSWPLVGFLSYRCYEFWDPDSRIPIHV
ncbi:hypothetical protein PM082_014551 [Marasmius tenuissimus]|nr:hypothetical protein PM082_014551 [Marasmius tenuissimus]